MVAFGDISEVQYSKVKYSRKRNLILCIYAYLFFFVQKHAGPCMHISARSIFSIDFCRQRLQYSTATVQCVPICSITYIIQSQQFGAYVVAVVVQLQWHVVYCTVGLQYFLVTQKTKTKAQYQRSRFFFASMLYRSTVSYLHIIIFPKQCMHCTVLYCKRTKGDKKTTTWLRTRRERERERKRERERERQRQRQIVLVREKELQVEYTLKICRF